MHRRMWCNRGMSLAAMTLAAALNAPAKPALIPMPESCTMVSGAPFVLTSATVLKNSSAFPAVEFLQEAAAARLGSRLNGSGKGGEIVFERASVSGPEGSYRLTINSKKVTVSAPDDRGAFYAVQTLNQLIAAPRDRSLKVSLPSLVIKDSPRFPWRGMHLDVSRHFFDVKFIKKYIDWLASYKMNIFHWHLLDDGGWRMESRKYPLLTQKGAWRLGKAGEWSYSNIVFPDDKTGEQVYGGFYTIKEMKEVVAYAAKKHVTVVPEIEMPGHNQPAIDCYPELGCRLDKRQVNNVFCPGNAKAMQFLKDILDETMEIFPSKHIHIGADEVNHSDWEKCPDCAKVRSDNHLKNSAELQSWFVRQMDEYLRGKGRILIGWDEILDGGLAPGAVVMSWRGMGGGEAAVKAGRQAIMTPTSHCYFDYSYESIPTEKALMFEPVPPGLTPAQEKLILGGQGNVWTEWIPTESRVQQMIFPRMLGLAEAFWSPRGSQNWEEFQPRLQVHQRILRAAGISLMPSPPPAAPVNAILFDREGVLQMPTARAEDLPLRYTTGTQPLTIKSPILPKTIKSNKALDVTYGYVDENGAVSSLESVHFRPAQRVTLPSSEGWNLEIFKGDFSEVADFEKLKPVSTSSQMKIDLTQAPSEEFYAFKFSGVVQFEAGDYEFRLMSDDGSIFRVGGATAVNHDGLHAATEKLGRVRIPAGAFPVELLYFQKGGAARLSLDFRRIGGPWKALDSSIVHSR